MAGYLLHLFQAYDGQYTDDGGNALPVLRSVHRGQDPIGIVDVGANIGSFSSMVISLFGDLEQHQASATWTPGGQGNSVELLALEPSPIPFALMSFRARSQQWNATGRTTLLQAAAGSVAGDATLYGCETVVPECVASGCWPERIENHCSLSPEATMVRYYRSPDAEIREEAIPIVRLDELLPATYGDSAGVFILKLDCEGHDHEVLHGAREFLAANKARWVIFEYSPRWRMDGMRGELLDETLWLGEHGYACFVLLAEGLLPLTGDDPWRSIAEHARDREVNVLCGLRADPALRRVVYGYGTDFLAAQYTDRFLEDHSRVRAGSRPGPPVPPELEQLPERPEIEQLSADVLRTIGDRFFYGDGPSNTPLNRTEAVRWYRLAAGHGDTYANYMVGFMHAYGLEGLVREAARPALSIASKDFELARRLLQALDLAA
jgi:FkbM family methyltransferase